MKNIYLVAEKRIKSGSSEAQVSLLNSGQLNQRILTVLKLIYLGFNYEM